ncbi:MAG: hypothetical protein KGL39_04305 [Patescibacteria group bacterium]|nr:hypothetical protein [Patescibacteria group bacterium]
MDRVAGKRGRHSASHEPRLALSAFRTSDTPTPPPFADVTGGITDWGMLGNDQYGDCGPAATEHNRMAKAGAPIPSITTTSTESLYFEYGLAQGEPGPTPDQGVDNASWLKFLFDKGIIEGYAEVNVANPDELKQAMIDFRGVIVGCCLTDSAEAEFQAGQPWNITPAEQPDASLGHDILLVAYGAGGYKFVTWGTEQLATVAWESFEAQGDMDAWVIITSEDAQRADVDLPRLQAEIRALGGTVSQVPQPPSPLPETHLSWWQDVQHWLKEHGL